MHTRFNLDDETSIGTMHAWNEEKRQQQKARCEESSGLEDEEEGSNANESIDGNGAKEEVVEGQSNVRVANSGVEEEELQLPVEERSWNEEDEAGSEGNSQNTAGTGSLNEGGSGWDEDDIKMEDLELEKVIEINSQSDSSSTGSNTSKSLSAEDNKEEDSDMNSLMLKCSVV